MAKTANKRPRGRPPKTGQDAPGALIGVRLSEGTTARLDKWRSAQGDKPPRTDAVRRLTESALTTDGF